MMLRKISFCVLVLVSSFGLSGQTINTDDSKVTFSVSNMAFNTVTGSFKGMEGTIHFLADDLTTSEIDVCIDASTVDTENEKRDEHLKNEDFFEVAKYPKICFKSSEIVKTTTGYKTTGILTMHGVSETVTIPFGSSLQLP